MLGKSKKGFTLIELVMVIVILGILSAIALPTFVNLQEDAKKSATKGALGGLRSAISIWYAKTAASSGTGAYPTVTQLSSCPGGPMQFIFPANPYTNSTKVNAGTAEAADTTAGWVYDASSGMVWSAAPQTFGSGF